jgi:hypothetical protein
MQVVEPHSCPNLSSIELEMVLIAMFLFGILLPPPTCFLMHMELWYNFAFPFSHRYGIA